MEEKRVNNSHILKNNKNELSLPDTMTYYKDIAMKTSWYWLGDRQEFQWNGTEKPGQTHSYTETCYMTEVALYIRGERMDRLLNGSGKVGCPND